MNGGDNDGIGFVEPLPESGDGERFLKKIFVQANGFGGSAHGKFDGGMGGGHVRQCF